MGIHGLTSLLKESLTSFATRVSFNDIVINGRIPIIVVDGSAFVYNICYEALGATAVITADYAQLFRAVVLWYEMYSQVGIKFIFVFDGPSENSKLPTKLTRMQKHANNIYQHISEAVSRGIVKPGKGQRSVSLKNVPPVLAFRIVLQALQEVGAEIFLATGEADSEIIRCAYEHDAIAMLSNDSDLLFTSVHSKYFGFLPFWALGFDAASGIAYGHVFYTDKFACLNGLSLDSLPLLAALAGNDFTDSDFFAELQLAVKHAAERVKLKSVGSATGQPVVTKRVQNSKKSSKANSNKKKKSSAVIAVKSAVDDVVTRSAEDNGCSRLVDKVDRVLCHHTIWSHASYHSIGKDGMGTIATNVIIAANLYYQQYCMSLGTGVGVGACKAKADCHGNVVNTAEITALLKIARDNGTHKHDIGISAVKHIMVLLTSLTTLTSSPPSKHAFIVCNSIDYYT